MDKKKKRLKKRLEKALEYYKALDNCFILLGDGSYYFNWCFPKSVRGYSLICPLIIKKTLSDRWISFKMRKLRGRSKGII